MCEETRLWSPESERDELRALTRAQSWMDDRFHWADLVGPLKKKTVPIHRLSYWYFLGGITLFLFLIQVSSRGLRYDRKKTTLNMWINALRTMRFAAQE